MRKNVKFTLNIAFMYNFFSIIISFFVRQEYDFSKSLKASGDAQFDNIQVWLKFDNKDKLTFL